MIDIYFIPAIFSVLGFLSLKPFIARFGLAFRFLISFFVSCLAIFVYFIAHSNLNDFSISPLGKSYFLAPISLCLLNMVALWVFMKLKKE